ncbi:DUF3021 domain-containing protein [Anaerofustis stercorihominis]|uniref:DUF3021 domain-containing protein n=1 Tax=Anaerofustis stercorihominis DSM 17244 TaxID=445971 RepID=B1CC57_9FIRM|nr:DUF3021 domain-containing protein [Anaerofustis stercorihominis]EDS71854.1 hypothetical protein ANASTE_01557 [Anaerofustis stercorihominis DSM 17244]MCQ4796093.1 DUF3021 domain-containing protein [Anaerofustis stercorihominis]
MKKIIKLILGGIAWGCTMFTIIGIIIALIMGQDNSFMMSTSDYIKQAVLSIIIGIGFTVPSIVYDYENISKFLQFTVHMGTGFCIYMICAYMAGWVPTGFGLGAVILSIAFWIIISLAIWFFFYMYYKKEAENINKKLKDN